MGHGSIWDPPGNRNRRSADGDRVSARDQHVSDRHDGGLQADPQLTGMWKGQTDDSGSIGYFTFFPQKDGSFKVMLLDPPASGDSGDWMALRLTIHTARARRLPIYGCARTGRRREAPDPRLAHVPVL